MGEVMSQPSASVCNTNPNLSLSLSFPFRPSHLVEELVEVTEEHQRYDVEVDLPVQPPALYRP